MVAKHEKIHGWDTVILKDNKLFFMFKCPADRPGDPYAATLVGFRKVSEYVTVPVYMRDDLHNIFAGFGICGIAFSGTIIKNVKSIGYICSYGIKNLLCQVWTVKSKKQDRSLIHCVGQDMIILDLLFPEEKISYNRKENTGPIPVCLIFLCEKW